MKPGLLQRISQCFVLQFSNEGIVGQDPVKTGLVPLFYFRIQSENDILSIKSLKKLNLLLLAGILAMYSCSMNDDINKEDNTTIDYAISQSFKEYFNDWEYQDVSKTETYNLMQTLINDLLEGFLRIDTFYDTTNSSMPTISLTGFNNYLWDSKEAVAFFDREDCFFVIASTIMTTLKTQRNDQIKAIELLIASDMFLSKTNLTEKKQLIVLALERVKNDKYLNVNPFTIMISIMLSSNYISFVEDVKPMLSEVTPLVCYSLKMKDGFKIPGYRVEDFEATDLILKYTMQFLNNKYYPIH